MTSRGRAVILVFKMARKGVRFGWALPFSSIPVADLLDMSRVVEEAGFNSVWSGDGLVYFPPSTIPEAWTILTAVAVTAKKVLLGTCVTDPHRYHPAVLAQRLATIDQFSSGRVILGLGAGMAINLEPFGIRWNKPVSRLVEAVKIIRRLWAGEKFSYDGEFWKFKDAFLQIKPIQSKVPIYFAANSTRMMRLTGEMAEGWLPMLLTPELYKKRWKLIEEAARKAGRAPDEIDTALWVTTSIADKAEAAYEQLKWVKPWIASMGPELLKEAGYEVKFPKEISPMHYVNLLPTIESKKLFDRCGEFVPREAAIEFSIGGTTQDCIDKIDEFVKAGVKHFILDNAGPDQRKVMELYRKEILPRFAE